MRNSFGLKAAVATAAAVLALTAPAMASVVLVDTSPQHTGLNDAGISYAVGYGANKPIGATWSSDPTVVVPLGNVSGIYQSPFNDNALTDSRNYFSVGAENGANGAQTPVTLTLAAAQTVFDILWGSIDTYNTISFFNGAATVASYTGSYIITNLLPGFGTFVSDGGTNSEQVALLHFAFDGGFDKVKFQSDNAAFEYALAAVPLPPALLLFGSGIAGLGMLARRRKNKLNIASALSA